MRSKLLSCITLLAAVPFILAQTPTQTTSPPAGTPILRTGTELVLVDVTVHDRAGHPVHGLTRNDFQITENKTAQALASFEELSSSDPRPRSGPELPPMPPGVFTDYQPVPAHGPLNVLLIDSLNTPLSDQLFLHDQLKAYVRHAAPGTRIAIFGLTSRLLVLQGFTSDPAVLRAALDHKLTSKSSVLLSDPTGTPSNSALESDALDGMQPAQVASMAANLQQFEILTQSFQNELRIQYTIDAFNALGHYLAAFPGRKNLIWFSGSFPINLLPDPDLTYPDMVAESNEPKFREMVNLLSRAQVAVYPIDARGVQSPSMYSAAGAGNQYVSGPHKNGQDPFSKAVGDFNQSQAQEHSTMDLLAEATGGQARYNTNDLASALLEDLDSGANYYALSYTPTDRRRNGDYRNITVQTTGAAAAQGYKLSYRKGYYADDPAKPAKANQVATPSSAASAPQVPDNISAAMGRGAPTPSELLFKVRVLPDARDTRDSVAPGNHPAAEANAKGPFRPYDVDFVVPLGQLTLALGPDGRRVGQVQFLTVVLDADGRLLNTAGHTVGLNLSPASYASLQQNGLRLRLQVSAPAKGDTYLRLAIHDLSSHKLGVVEVPTAFVSRLDPPNDAPAQPAGHSQAPAPPPVAAPSPSAASSPEK